MKFKKLSEFEYFIYGQFRVQLNKRIRLADKSQVTINVNQNGQTINIDAYMNDSIAFIHPEYSYEMCEDAVFLSDSAFDAKYR